MAIEDIAGMRLKVDCEGSGEPALVFVHGFACDGSDWDAQRRALASRFKVVTFDLPGHGESSTPESGSMESLARTAWEVTRRYGGNRTVLIGHSLGCRVIPEMLRQSADGIAGLVFVDGGLTAGGDNAEAAASALEKRLDATGFYEFMIPIYEQMFTPRTDPGLRQHALSRLRRVDAEFGRQVLLSAIQWEANESTLLAGVTVPTLMLQGAYLDENFNWHNMKPGMTTRWTELVTRRIPGAELRIVPDVGHFVHIEAAEAVNQYLGEFAGRLSR